MDKPFPQLSHGAAQYPVIASSSPTHFLFSRFISLRTLCGVLAPVLLQPEQRVSRVQHVGPARRLLRAEYFSIPASVKQNTESVRTLTDTKGCDRQRMYRVGKYLFGGACTTGTELRTV